MRQGREPKEIVMYGSERCPECSRARRFLDDRGIRHLWVDIDKDPDGLRYVEAVNCGLHSVPTIVLADGEIVVEPSEEQLAAKLGMRPPSDTGKDGEWR